MARTWLTPERVRWLRENYSKYSVSRTCDLFNQRFGTDIRIGQMRSANSNHGFGKANRRGSKTFKPWEEGWLQHHLPLAPRKEVATAFEKVWGWKPKHDSLDRYVTKHGLQGAPNVGCFRKGQVPPNKGRKGYSPPGSEKGWFKKGSVPANKKPLYAERWTRQRGGGAPMIEINVPVENPYTGHKNFWIRKAVWVWMQANQRPVPEGHVIVQLDGDPANCELDNLDCVSKAVMARLNQKYSPAYAGREANPARVRLAQLKHAIAGRSQVSRGEICER